MKFRPLGDRVVVKRTDEEETTEGGIVIPGSAAEKPSQGEILAVGPGKTLESGKVQPLTVIPGSQKWPKSIFDFKHRIKTFFS